MLNLECHWCHRTFSSKRNRNLCADCKFAKATGGDLMGISRYGSQKQRSDYPPLLNAADISKPVTYTIVSAQERDMKGEKKLIVGFKETEKQWVVNKTNIQALAERYGDVEPKDLVGKQVMLASVPTTYDNKPTKGIRVVG